MLTFPENCVEWPACRDDEGYGKLGRMRAHRMMYELFIGPIPDGLHVLHKCDNPPCVNPAHLWLGTHSENMSDMKEKGRAVAPSSRLTRAEVLEIRASKELLRVLAARFGVSVQCISDTRCGKTYRRVA